MSELLRKLRHFELFARAGGIYVDIGPEKIMLVLLISSRLGYATCSKQMSSLLVLTLKSSNNGLL